MKIKFKNSFHRKAFTDFVSENIKDPYASRFDSTGCRTVSPKGAARTPRQQSETRYIAAVFLLSSDKFLWKRSLNALTGYFINFNDLYITGISTDGYALFKAAKMVYKGESDISLNELCDPNLIDYPTVMTIFAGVALLRNGIGMLNWKVKA